MQTLHVLSFGLALCLIGAASLPSFSSAQEANREEDLERARELRRLLEARRERADEERESTRILCQNLADFSRYVVDADECIREWEEEWRAENERLDDEYRELVNRHLNLRKPSPKTEARELYESGCASLFGQYTANYWRCMGDDDTADHVECMETYEFVSSGYWRCRGNEEAAHRVECTNEHGFETSEYYRCMGDDDRAQHMECIDRYGRDSAGTPAFHRCMGDEETAQEIECIDRHGASGTAAYHRCMGDEEQAREVECREAHTAGSHRYYSCTDQCMPIEDVYRHGIPRGNDVVCSIALGQSRFWEGGWYGSHKAEFIAADIRNIREVCGVDVCYPSE